MRIFRHHLHFPIVVLAVAETLVFFAIPYLGAYLRFDTQIAAIEEDLGALWPRAALYTAVMQTCMVAMGLQRALAD